MLRRHLSAAVGLFAALFAGSAHADPVTVVTALIVASKVAIYVKIAAIVAAAAYSSAKARRKARAAQAAAKAKALESLSDRTLTVLREDPPWRVIYGEAVTGGDVHDIVTHDKTAKREDGSAYTRPDAYQSVVIVWSDRRCKAVKDIQIEGVSIGAVDANGWVTSAPFMASGEGSRRTLVTGSITLSEAVTEIISAYQSTGGSSTNYTSVTATLSNGNKTITITGGLAGVGAWVTYKVSNGQARVRVEHYLGTPGQAASAYLISVGKGKWDASKRFANKCYSVITLDLEDARFSSLPNITATIEGADEILDPRTGITGHSSNPALCIYDWLRGIWGLGLDADDIDVESVKAAANACDVNTTYQQISVLGVLFTFAGPRYSCNGVFTTDGGKEAVLADLCESMAGHASYAGVWRLDAGAWTAPVFALTDASNTGPIEVIQAGEPEDQIFNGVRGQYILAGTRTPADFDPYQNSAFVAADGEPLWLDITLPFTNSKPRCAQICRVLTERERNGLIIRYPAKFSAWHLQPGDRVTVTNAEYGWSAKTFRVTDWAQSPGAGVLLTLQEDEAAAYDLADAVSADPTPNTNLPNPLQVAAMPAITCTSGSSELLKMGDRPIVPHVRVPWGAITDAYVLAGGIVEVRWRNVDSVVWTSWEQTQGSDTSILLSGMTERTPILVEARLRNALGVFGSSAFAGHVVIGKLAAPTNATNIVATVSGGQAIIAMDPCPDVDYAETEVRIGNTSSTWATATRLGVGSQNVFGWMPYPAVGTYNVFVTHFDASGNSSTPQAIVATVTSAGITSAASGTNLVMNGDFWRRRTVPNDPGRPYDPEGFGVYDWGVGTSGVWGWADEVSADGERAFALTNVVAMPAKPDTSISGSSVQPVRLGFVTASNIQDGLTQGGVSGGWRPNTDYTISFLAYVARAGTGGGTESAITNLASTGQSGTTPTGTGTVSMTLPTVAAGSLHIVVASLDDFATAGIAAPAGWTRIGTQQGATGNPDGRVTSAWYKIAAAGDPAAFVLSVTGGGGYTYSIACSSYSGCDTTTPVSVVGAWSAAGAGIATNQPITAAGITTTGNTGLVWLGATDKASGPANTLTAPAGFAMRRSQWDSTNASNAHIADKLPKAANGTVAATSGTLASGGAGYDVVMIALKPATSGGGTVDVATEWEGVMMPVLAWNITPPTIENNSDNETLSYIPRLFRYRIRTGATVEGNGTLYVAARRINSATQMPGLAANARLVFRRLMISQGTDYPDFDLSAQDDLRALSITTGALSPSAATEILANRIAGPVTYSSGA